jgi:hypothetical protein
VTIATTYTLRADADRVEIRTTMTNTGNTPLSNLLSGQTLWPSAGYFFGIPVSRTSRKARRQERSPIGSWPMTKDWAITLHAPYFDYVGSGSLDLFRSTRSDPANHGCSTRGCKSVRAAILARRSPAEIDRKHLDSGKRARRRDELPMAARSTSRSSCS